MPGKAQAVEPIIVAVILTQVFVFRKLLSKTSLDYSSDWNYRVSDSDQKNVSNVFRTEADARDFMEKAIHKKWQIRRGISEKVSAE